MMGISKITVCPVLGIVMALVSCASPKAQVVEEVTVVKKEEKAADPVVEESSLPVLPDDGLRMPDMLAMPSDGDFRSTNPVPMKGTQSGAVISRPPTDPPSRVKPDAE